MQTALRCHSEPKAATEGSHESLSFIPGNNFLGIVAQNYAQYTVNEQAEISIADMSDSPTRIL